jgi:hypothetical protein
MDRSQATGALIMAGAALQLLVFLAGLTRKSYLALALPVAGAMAALSALAFWVGWTMLTTPADSADMDAPAEQPQ